MNLTVTARTASGLERTLCSPLELTLKSDRHVPCDGLTAVFPLQWEEDAFARIRVDLDGEALFQGMVDRQALERSAQGNRLRLECRSLAALLVDNEARPAVFSGVDQAQVLREYGMGIVSRLPKGRAAVLQIPKGISCWQAIARFCAAAYGKEPFLNRQGALVLDPLTARSRTFSNREGIRYQKLSLLHKNEALYSKVHLRTAIGENGALYGVAISNPEANLRGVRRERYLNPQLSTSDVRQEARQLIAESNRDSFQADLVLPGLVSLEIGDRAFLPDENLRAPLYISRLTWQLSSSGMTTLATLRPQSF